MLRSPYHYGAGHSPDVLAGRDSLLAEWREIVSALSDGGRAAGRDIALTGPRGVGKTVTMTEFKRIAADDAGYDVISLQSVAGSQHLLDGLLHAADARIRERRPAWERVKGALERLGGVSLGVATVTGGVSLHPPQHQRLPLTANSFGDVLSKLAVEINRENRRGGLLVSVDELQVTAPDDLALLAGALSYINQNHPGAPVGFVATGLPNTYDALEAAHVTHPDRLIDQRKFGLELTHSAARYAVAEPAHRRGVFWDSVGLEHVIRSANHYPAHLQLMAHHVWTAAEGPDTITLHDAEVGVLAANDEIERRTLEPRWDRATDRQVEMLAALAANGGLATSQQLNSLLGRPQNEWGTTRAELIASGDVYPPKRARLALTVPAFASYILSHYEERRSDAVVEIRELKELKARARAIAES